MDPREDQSTQKEPKVVSSILWSKDQIRKVFSEKKPEEPSYNNISPDLDPREDQSAQKEPKVVSSILWSKDQGTSEHGSANSTWHGQ